MREDERRKQERDENQCLFDFVYGAASPLILFVRGRFMLIGSQCAHVLYQCQGHQWEGEERGRERERVDTETERERGEGRGRRAQQGKEEEKEEEYKERGDEDAVAAVALVVERSFHYY